MFLTRQLCRVQLKGAYMVTRFFNKRPSEENLYKRSLSFQNDEIENIKDTDKVLINVADENNTTVFQLEYSGKEFNSNLNSFVNAAYKVFRF